MVNTVITDENGKTYELPEPQASLVIAAAAKYKQKIQILESEKQAQININRELMAKYHAAIIHLYGLDKEEQLQKFIVKFENDLMIQLQISTLDQFRQAVKNELENIMPGHTVEYITLDSFNDYALKYMEYIDSRKGQ